MCQRPFVRLSLRLRRLLEPRTVWVKLWRILPAGRFSMWLTFRRVVGFPLDLGNLPRRVGCSDKESDSLHTDNIFAIAGANPFHERCD
jgi:hypothetical protein